MRERDDPGTATSKGARTVTSSLVVGAAASEVFSLLVDPEAFASWVVGARRIRAVDPTWPQPGARFHHAVGVGPFATRDSTEVRQLELNRSFQLEVRFRPAGVALVTISLAPLAASATRVTLDEVALRGPARWLWPGPVATLLRVRNDASLRRLGRLVESRTQGTAADAATPEIAAGTGHGIVVEELTYDLAPDEVDAWAARDAAVWTPALGQRQGFLGKQVWADLARPGRLRLVIWWTDDDAGRDGRALSDGERAQLAAAMGPWERAPTKRRDHRLIRVPRPRLPTPTSSAAASP